MAMARRRRNIFLAGPGVKVEYLKYNWSLNEQTGAGKEKG